MITVPGSEFEIEAELVLLAMGFVHVEHSRLTDELGVEYDQRGNIKTDSEYRTSVEGVFAAGDASTGASLVVRAIDHGRRAADSIIKYLH
jgi:NADPH-dependent glutamate synthase beta subunit-like oxidoreductase